MLTLIFDTQTSIRLKKSEASESVNYIACPYCGYMMTLIRPRNIKIDLDQFEGRIE